MFRPTSVIIGTAVENVLIAYNFIERNEISYDMSERIDWLKAVEIWGWCNGVILRV